MPHKPKPKRQKTSHGSSSKEDPPRAPTEGPSGIPSSTLAGSPTDTSASIEGKTTLHVLDVSSYLQEHEALKVALPTLKSDYANVKKSNGFLLGVTSSTTHKVRLLQTRLDDTEVELKDTKAELGTTKETVKRIEQMMAKMDARITALEGRKTVGDF